MELLFATGNEDKLREVKKMLKNDSIKMPKDIGIDDFDVIEDGDTLKENAYKKAYELYKLTKKAVFADDTGLFVDALDGRPGIYSHRYTGNNASYLDNRIKLLSELEGNDNRGAYFETVIAYIDEKGNDYYFNGVLKGKISTEDRGEGEFGYDKIFLIENIDKTLGEMTIEEKNEVSHRARAMEKFKEFLEIK